MNRHTVLKALAELVAEGWIESKERIAYYVLASPPIEQSLSLRSKHNKKALFNFNIVKQAFAESVKPDKEAHQYQYNFAGGQADLTSFPFLEFKRHMSSCLNYPHLTEYAYGGVAGTTNMRKEAANYLRSTRGIVDRDIVITNGTQEAIYVLAKLLLKKSDVVAVETLAYPPAIAAFKNAGAKVKAIKQDEHGIVPDDLRKQVKQHNISLLYLTPLHQYPTTVTLAVSRRQQIYEIACKHQIPIIEDDYDHEFHYKCQPLAPMVTDDPYGLVIYIATLSKIMFPGARVGFMALPKNLSSSVIQYRAIVSNKPNVIMQEALTHWMASGGFTRHLRRMTRQNEKRRDHAVALLKQSSFFDFNIPDGGMALWLQLKNPKHSARELVAKAKQQDIFMQAEGEFHVDSPENQDRHIRLGFAGMPENKFALGIAKLMSLMLSLIHI